MALLDDVRTSLRVTSTLTDAEIQIYINAAIEDMRRVGIRDELLVPETMSSLASSAVVMYCKANYGFLDGVQSAQFWNWYIQTVTALKMSPANEVLYTEPEAPDDDSPGSDPDDGTTPDDSTPDDTTSDNPTPDDPTPDDGTDGG